MSRPGEKGDRSVALFLLALLLFSPLFVSIFSSEELFLGLPPLFLYLFAAWGGIIAAVGWSASRDKDEPSALGRNNPVVGADQSEGIDRDTAGIRGKAQETSDPSNLKDKNDAG